MAEVILSAILTSIFEKLTSEALKKLALSKGIHQQLKKLESWLPQIRAVLVDAAQKEISDEFVKRWLDDLQHLAYDIDDVLEELATKAMDRELAEKSGASTSKKHVIMFWEHPPSPDSIELVTQPGVSKDVSNGGGLVGCLMR